MPQFERGHSGPEIGEMQQRLADLGFEVTPTNEFDEYTEEALRRYQTDWLYAEGTGVADDETLTQLESHHANREPQFGLIDEETQTQLDGIGADYGQQFGAEPVYGAGGSAQVSEDGQHWWDGQNWIPFANPTPHIDSETLTEVGQAVSGAYEEVKREAGELWDGVVDEASKIISGEEPLPDVRN